MDALQQSTIWKMVLCVMHGGKKILRLQINTCFLLSSVSLEMLYLGGNLISAIPPEVANLPYLTYLVLCDNRIQSVPPQLTR